MITTDICVNLFSVNLQKYTNKVIVLYHCPALALTDVNNIIVRRGGKQADKTVNLFVSRIKHCLVFVLLCVPFAFSSCLLQSNDCCH